MNNKTFFSLLLVTLLVLLFSCSNEPEQPIKSNEAKILKLTFKKEDNSPWLSSDIESVIDEDNKKITATIDVDMFPGFQPESIKLVPEISISESSIIKTPDDDISVNKLYSYVVTAENGKIVTYTFSLKIREFKSIEDLDFLYEIHQLNPYSATHSWDFESNDLEKLKASLNFGEESGSDAFSEVIFEDNRIVSLRFKGMRLWKVPESIGSLDSLRVLSLSSNNISDLPEEITKLENLEVLFLGHKFEIFPEQVLAIKSLKKFAITPKMTIPEGIGDLTNLEELYLSGFATNNGIQTVPENISKLTKLKKLILGFNKIEKLPEDFGNLINLEYLDLQYNDLENLPSSFSSLTNLTYLSVRNNRLTHLPDFFGNLIKLGDLRLQNNKLNYLPEDFGRLESLKILYLRYNNLISLPESFGNLKSLELVNIHANNLIKLPDNFGDLTNLRSAYIGPNFGIRELPDSFDNLENIEELMMSGTGISEIPVGFTNFRKLKRFYIPNDCEVPDEFCAFIEEIGLTDTNIEEQCE